MKYPRIPHVSFSNPTDVDDIISDQTISGRMWILTEKIDGSQLSIQFIDQEPDIRNRNTKLMHGNMDKQFHPLPVWYQYRRNELYRMLGNKFILFGEWCFHVHTVYYNKLPADWFIGFGIYDKEKQEFLPFLDAKNIMEKFNIPTVPIIDITVLKDQKHLLSYISTSKFGDGEMEGIVLHSLDDKIKLKYVTKKFKDSVNDSIHWRKKERKKNVRNFYI